jgi:CRP-like cAMP-binding protein
VNFPRLDGLILNLCWEPRPGVSVFPGKVGEGVPGLDKESIVATLLRRLNAVTGLNEADIAAIRALPIIVRPWEAGRAIVSDGDRPTECCLVIEGFCVRSKTIVNGQRQILSIHIPGDVPTYRAYICTARTTISSAWSRPSLALSVTLRCGP